MQMCVFVDLHVTAEKYQSILEFFGMSLLRERWIFSCLCDWFLSSVFLFFVFMYTCCRPCSPRVCVGSLHVPRLLAKTCKCRWIGDSKFTLRFVTVCLWLRLCFHGNDLNRKCKSGVAFSLFIPHLDACFWGEICVHLVMQKLMGFDLAHMPGG